MTEYEFDQIIAELCVKPAKSACSVRSKLRRGGTVGRSRRAIGMLRCVRYSPSCLRVTQSYDWAEIAT
jgi:hypothetical protein